MTYFITAHTNNRARLIVSETRTTHETIVPLIIAALEAQGHIVTVRDEA